MRSIEKQIETPRFCMMSIDITLALDGIGHLDLEKSLINLIQSLLGFSAFGHVRAVFCKARRICSSIFIASNQIIQGKVEQCTVTVNRWLHHLPLCRQSES